MLTMLYDFLLTDRDAAGDGGHCGQFIHNLRFKATYFIFQHAQIATLEVTADTAAKERDFYFGKLRHLEVLCQTPGMSVSKVCDQKASYH